MSLTQTKSFLENLLTISSVSNVKLVGQNGHVSYSYGQEGEKDNCVRVLGSTESVQVGKDR